MRARRPPAVGVLLALAVAFNAVTLLPELTVPVPSNNDDATHYALVQRASEALARGENVLDPWFPQLELGFPWFIYYQPLPALTVVAVQRALLGIPDLLTVFNAVRYALLVLFPLTVFWSLRRLGIGAFGAATAGAAASLFSGDFRYGFEYDSYTWRGFGMFTQLVAMHLSLVVFAQLWRTLERGRELARTSLAVAALVLTHLLYAYMAAITAGLLVIAGAPAIRDLPRRALRLAAVGALALVLTAWMWVPFLQYRAFLGISPYLQTYKYDSFGAPAILGWLATGDLLDHGRPPVLTALLALGIVGALVTRTRLARAALALFTVWLVLYFGRPTLGPLLDLLPLHEGLLLHRFIGSVELFAIVLIGIGADWALSLAARPLPRRALLVSTAAVALLLVPAAAERRAFHDLGARWMRETAAAIDADADARAIVDHLRSLPPARVFAGLRTTGFGPRLNFGLPFNSVRMSDYLVFNGVAVVASPYTSFNLNADLMWDFSGDRPALYDLLNVRYVVRPSGDGAPPFLVPLLTTSRYTLYVAHTTGYAAYAGIRDDLALRSQRRLFEINRAWFNGPDPSTPLVHRFTYPAATDGARPFAVAPCAQPRYEGEDVTPSRIAVTVSCPTDGALVFKVTYHPNWIVTVDGVARPTFMASPSYVGVALPAGAHHVVADYAPSPAKLPLAALMVLVLLILAAAARRDGPSAAARRLLARLSPLWRRGGTAALTAFLALASLAALGDLSVRAALRLEPRWDTFMYHLPFAALRSGFPLPYVLNERYQGMYDGFPPLPHLVEGLLWRLTGSPNATGVANVLALAAFLVFCHRWLRAPFWIVAPIALTAPLVVIHAAVSYVDLFGNALLAIGVAGAAYLWLHPERLPRPAFWGALLGLTGAAWSKYLLVPIAVLVFAALGIVLLGAIRRGVATRRAALVPFVVALLVAGLPYGKNLVLYGNPFWPYRLPVPVLAGVVPYEIDGFAGSVAQKPPPLADQPQAILFFRSLLEIGHPTSYPNRPRWIIDQGNAWLAYRSGGFWWVNVLVYTALAAVLLAACHGRRGAAAAGGGLLLLALVSVLPQSHELRYYQFLPLSWAAVVGMTLPRLEARRTPLFRAGLIVVATLFLYMVSENLTHYRIDRLDYAQLARQEGMPQRWSEMSPGVRYCVVDAMPIAVMFTGPTLREYTVIDRSSAELCPPGTTIIAPRGRLAP